MAVTPEEFGRALRAIRRSDDINITLDELSRNSGVSQSYLSQIENGKTGIPSPDVLKKIADALPEAGVRYSHLLRIAGYEELAEGARMREIQEDFGEAFSELELSQIREQTEFVAGITDIKRFLERTVSPHATYNGHLLKPQDKKRILGMLEQLFPEYQQPLIPQPNEQK